MRNQILILAILLVATRCVTVTTKDSCDACAQFKSPSDCKNYSGASCTWTEKTATTAGSCAVSVDPYVPYCTTLESPASNCAKQRGCAYVDSKCSQFAGCSAYAKTTTAECQAISYLCISDGTQCTNVLECSNYSKEQCESTPSLYSPFKCKLDGETCRAYNCDEADPTLTTDTACNAWLSGCVSTGQGCIATLPSCTAYTGTAATCPLMKGTEGICDFDSTAQKCKARECTGAPETTILDADCGKYKTGCVTTGKGCIAVRGSCTSYAGNSSTCVGFIGTEGFCAGDATGTQCRARKCDEKTAITNKDCDDWKTGCITNGKTCVTSPLGACSSYSGTTTSCEGYIGSDGNCKGTSTTSSPCAAKDCVTDSKGNETTDTACQKIQSTCKTTGKGCAKTLSSCTTYSFTDDGTSCLSLVGLEGRCKAGTAGKCAVKLCTDAPNTATSNKACSDFQTGCVTTGAGCVSQQTCTDVSKQLTCEGSTTNSCIWNATCVSNSSCSQFLTKSLCNGYKVSNKPCIWDSGCRNARCSDFKGASDSICNELLTDCVSNGTDCVDGTDCSKFQGVQATCEGFKAKCTNPTSVTDVTTPCVARTCDDAHLTFDNDTQCDNYKSGCVTKGTGCILGTSACSAYTGTPDQCDKFKGSSGTVRCWNTAASGNCVDKACTHATGMTDNIGCDGFLTGCLYDGNGSCVLASASCSAYTGDSVTKCSAFIGNSGTKPCYWTGGSNCKTKTCEDNTVATSDSDCGDFLTTCLTDNSGCVSATTPCSSYTGTTTECNAFTGNSKTCTRLEACTVKTCSNKTDAADNAACLSYHSSCRQSQGTTNCIAAPAACTGFNSFATGATDPQKQTYCNSVTDSTGNSCSYSSSSSTTCAVRACNLWVNTLTVACKDYNGNNSCVQNTNDNLCYTLGACSGYSIPGTLNTASTKATWCGAITDSNGKTCVYDQVADKCDVASAITTCEQVYAADESECNKFLNVGTCKFYGSKCYTIQAACTSYSLTGITTQAAFCSGHYQSSSNVVTKCAYDSGTTGNCVVLTCDLIASPTSQTDCDVIDGCKYYASKCYARVACTAYTATGTDAQKQLFCQNMYDDATNDFCSWETATTGTCTAPKVCSDYSGLTANTSSNTATCLGYRDKTGPICQIGDLATATACSITSGAAICSSVPTPGSLADCQIHTSDICSYASSACTLNTACASIDTTGQTNKITFCQAKKGVDGFYCTSDTTNCIVGKNACTDWTGIPSSGQLAYCQSRIDKNGNQCSWVAAATTCSDFICSDLTSPKSQADCDTVSAGCLYAPQTKKCIKKEATCNLYTPTGTDADKLKYCNSVTSTAGDCTFIFGSSACIAKAGCTTYTVSSASDKIAACQSISTTDGAGCTYFAGANCIVKVACASYTGGTTATIVNDCTKQTDTSAAKCYPAYGTGATACIAAPANCEAITNATSQAYCDIYVSGCVYSSITNACITPKSDCTYAYAGATAISFCNSLKNTLGNFCTADLDADTVCKNRACGDTAANLFTTHLECQTYSSLCKSDGTKCVSATVTCASQSGNSSYCNWALDIDGKSTCQADTPATTGASCVDFDCGQNVYSTTNVDCISFNSNCLTKGDGCISKTAPCSSYYGTKTTCGNFTGNGKKCWGDSTTKAACRDRVCTDKTTATNLSDCDQFLTGCIYNGQGCVNASASCTAYKGTQTECANYMGVNNTQYCWGTSATTSGPCTVRKCSDKTATSDTECNNFMLPISPSTTVQCITDGTTCTDNNKACSFFKGNDETCSKFTSTEGICKASSYSTSPVACTPRVCYEAPNSLTTDAQCEAYQKNCKTTGRGCVYSPSCNDLQTSTVCSAKTGCLWANQCRVGPTTCVSMNSSGQSICMNTTLQNGKKCAWYNGACRDYTCADYDASIVTHLDCQSKDTTCTTSGAGCVTLGACSTYRSRSVCESANTTDVSKRCTWNSTTNSCRQRKCTDGTFTSDDDCDKFLSGCKTSGSACVGPSFGCDVFTGNPKFCLKNSSGQPCLKVNNVCYDFDDCTDAPFNTLTTCQLFSSLCVTNTSTCRAMTFCEKYENQIQCTQGLSSTATPQTCGWLPTGKCANFNNCSEAAGATLQDCVNWNSKCVSDGSKCVERGNCATYGNEIACGNAGLDGQCKWTGSACRLRECGDNVAVTDADCQAYTVAAGVCTTDGTKCVLRGTCSSYLSEASCTTGADGVPCVFDFPVGTTTGTKSCRPKECSDIKGTSNDQCVRMIPNKACVSDGTTCVKQDTCANYKNKISCKAGGSDGACAFSPAPTATNVNAGTCQLFKSCENANKDQDTCGSKPKSCKWTSTTQGTTITTSCVAMDCASAASGTNCVTVPNFDASSFTICVLTNGVCTAGDPTTLLQDQCYKSTLYSYTWNEATNKCASCKGITQPNNSTNGNTSNNTNSTTTTDSGYILGVTIPLAIIGLFA